MRHAGVRRLTSQTDLWDPQVSDWASPVSTADQSAGQHSCWAPQVSGPEVPPWSHVGGARQLHVGDTSAMDAGDVRRDGVDGELAVVHRRGPGGHHSTQEAAAHLLVVVALPETAGVIAGDEPRRRGLRVRTTASFLSSFGAVRARVRTQETFRARWTKPGCQRCGQTTAATTTAAVSYGVHGRCGYGTKERARAVGEGGGAYRECRRSRVGLGDGVTAKDLTTASGGAERRKGDAVLDAVALGPIPAVG